MNKRITLSVVGLDAALNQRIAMAGELLASSGLQVQTLPWDGTRRDVLIANADDAYGQRALDTVNRRQGRLIAVSAAGQSRFGQHSTISPGLPVVEITRRLRSLLDDAPATEPRRAGGLLQACLQPPEASEHFLAQQGRLSLLIRRDAARISARSHSDLIAARSRLLDTDWQLQPVAAEYQLGEASHSLDAFLIAGCRLAEQRMPMLSSNDYRLTAWPELGGLTDDIDAMRLSSALTSRAWSVAALAEHCQLPPGRVNGFLWAMLGAGLLSTQHVTLQTLPSPPPTERSLFAKLARRFGLLTGR